MNNILSKEEFLQKLKTDDEFAKKWGDLGPIYGKQWRRWDCKKVEWNEGSEGGFTVHQTYIDQIANLINKLKTNPDDRRMMVTAWNPAEVDNCVLPPCHYGFQVYTRELSLHERFDIHRKYLTKDNLDLLFEIATDENLDKLGVPRRAISLKWNQRSVDTPLGLPFNIASYGLLLEIIAKIVNMVPDELIGSLGDTHIYLNQIEGCNEQMELTRQPFPLPTLHINTEFWPTKSGECGVGELTDNIDALINEIRIDDFQIENYQSHPSIKFPLSN